MDGTGLRLSADVNSQQTLTFEPPRLIDHGQSPADFLALATPNGKRVVLGREQNLLSIDGGASWHPSSSVPIRSAIHRIPEHPMAQRELMTIGRWQSGFSNGTLLKTMGSRRFSLMDGVAPSLPRISSTAAPAMPFVGLPRPVRLFRWGGSSSLALPSGGWLKSAIVNWADPKPRDPTHGAPCSVIVFNSTSDGRVWRYIATLADAADYPQSEEGPNEHDVALLADGLTLLAVIRMDGGDGVGSPYLNYSSTLSSDFGATWSRLRPTNAGCARPRLMLLGKTLLLSGGRHRSANTSDALLWANADDGRGERWRPYSLSYHHNAGAAPGTALFDARVNKSRGPWHEPRETNAYTSIVPLDDSSALITYDYQQPCAGSTRLTLPVDNSATDTLRAGATCTTSFSMVVHVG